MPERKHIPDDASYVIMDGNKKLAEYCRHCNRFTKGKSAHSTKEHRGNRLFKYVSPTPDGPASAPAPAPAPGPAPPPAGGNLATFPSHLDPATVPVVDRQVHFQDPLASYDFGTMPTFPGHLAQTDFQRRLAEFGLTPADSDDEDLFWIGLNM